MWGSSGVKKRRFCTILSLVFLFQTITITIALLSVQFILLINVKKTGIYSILSFVFLFYFCTLLVLFTEAAVINTRLYKGCQVTKEDY